jgi:hypothetical protein
MLEMGHRMPDVSTTFDGNLARIRAHRNNIHRYRKLLRTKLTDIEREFINRRLVEEQSSLDALVAENFPTFGLPDGAADLRDQSMI